MALYVFGGLNCEQGWLSSVWKGIVEADKSRSLLEKMLIVIKIFFKVFVKFLGLK